MRRFLEHDALTGIVRWMDFDPSTGMVTEYAEADAQASLDHATRLRNDDDYWRKGVKNDMAHYAHIPNILLEKWMHEGVNISDPDALIEMVNKPEYRYLKTTSKVVLAKG